MRKLKSNVNININKEEMKKGYLSMGEINLQISTESFHLETEGASLGYEMDITQAQGEAK
jgi:hypothetical protein